MTNNRLLMPITICLIAIFFISGCANQLGIIRQGLQKENSILSPGPLLLHNLPQGDDSYSQGYRDGCETFVGIVGTGVLRMLPSTIDGWRLTSDSVYARGFSDASSHCTFYLDWDTH